MDPLSITAGTLAIIGAIDASAKCLRKLSCLRKAPTELSDLQREATDLHAVLLLVAAVHDEDEEKNGGKGGIGQELPATRLSVGTTELKSLARSNLEWHAEQAALALDDLNRIVCDYSASLQSGKRLAHGFASLSWVQSGRKKAIKLLHRLHDIRSNIITTLGIQTSAGIRRVEKALSEHSLHEPETFTHIANSINITVNNPNEGRGTSIGASVSQDPWQFPVSNTEPFNKSYCSATPTVMTKKWLDQTGRTAAAPSTASPRAPSGTIAAAVATALRNSCAAWCSCCCHTRGYVRSPPIFDPIFGSISTVYGGILSAARPCNEYSCRRRSDKALKLNYRPPPWLYSHLFRLSIVSTPMYGLKLDLHFPRTVTWDAPIWTHAMDGDVDAIQGLFSRGVASPWDVNPIGGSMLHYAADHRKFELCKLLLTSGADPQHEDDCRRNPAVMAWDHVLSNKLSSDEEYSVGSLFGQCDYIESQGFTQLHKTVLGLVPRDLETELSCSTAEINVQDANGRTPLAWAARRGDTRKVHLLLSHGADVNIANNQGFTPIHEAINVPTARALLSKGADAMSRNAWGRTPLHQVCDRGDNVSLMELFISSGADVDAADLTGEVALHTAIVHENIKHDNTGHAAYLIRNGASSMVTNLSGDSPLRFAIMFNTHEVLTEILKHPFSFQDTKHVFGHTFAHSIARTADVKTLRILEGVASEIVLDLTTTDNSGKTVMNYAHERSGDPTMAAAFEHFANAVNQQEILNKVVAAVSSVEVSDSEGDEQDENIVYYDTIEYSVSPLPC